MRAAGEARVRELVAKHNANLEALNAAAEAEASKREAQLAQILQPLEALQQKAVDDLDPEAAEKIQLKIDEATAAAASANAIATRELDAAKASATAAHRATVESTSSFYATRAAKLGEILAARAALAAAESDLVKKPKAAEVTSRSFGISC